MEAKTLLLSNLIRLDPHSTKGELRKGKGMITEEKLKRFPRGRKGAILGTQT